VAIRLRLQSANNWRREKQTDKKITDLPHPFKFPVTTLGFPVQNTSEFASRFWFHCRCVCCNLQL